MATRNLPADVTEDEYDLLVRRALYGAAGELQAQIAATSPENLAEADLNAAMRQALRLQEKRDVFSEASIAGKLADWPRAGSVDLGIRAARADRYDVLVELKWCRNTRGHTEIAWDACKLAALVSAQATWASFIVVGAPVAAARSNGIGHEILAGCQRTTRELWAAHTTAWGNPRTPPLRLPAGVRTSAVATASIQRADADDWELRCVRVRSTSGRSFEPPQVSPMAATDSADAPGADLEDRV